MSEDALRTRKLGLLARTVALATKTTRLDHGYRMEFASDSTVVILIAAMIDAERECCRFLRFTLTVESGLGPITLELTGPEGTQQFLEALLELA